MHNLKIYKKIIVVFGVICLYFNSFSQIVYRDYSENKYLILPGHMQFDNRFLLYSLINTGFDNDFSNVPENKELGVYQRLFNKSVVGGRLRNYTSGLNKEFDIQLAYNYNTKISKKYELGLSLWGDFVQSSINVVDAHVFEPNDPTLEDDYSSDTYLTYGFGADFRYNNFEIDFIIPRLIDYNANYYNEYIASSGYKFIFNEGQLSVKPHVLYKFSQANRNYLDFGIVSNFRESLTLALSYQNVNSGCVSLGYTFRGFLSANVAYIFKTKNQPDPTNNTFQFLLIFKKGKDRLSIYKNYRMDNVNL